MDDNDCFSPGEMESEILLKFLYNGIVGKEYQGVNWNVFSK